MRSLLGPDPILGARFYGIGNELKSGLAVLVLAAVAAALYPCRARPPRGARDGQRGRDARGRRGLRADRRGRRRRDPRELRLRGRDGHARCRGALTRRRALIVLSARSSVSSRSRRIDLATAHGAGHFTGSVLHARSAGDLRDIIVRRYGAAWDELHNHAMPVATASRCWLAAVGLRAARAPARARRRRSRLAAALAGGLAAGVVGALVEDSGPMLLVVAVFALGCVASYLWGRPVRGISERASRGPRATDGLSRSSRARPAGPLGLDLLGLPALLCAPPGANIRQPDDRPASSIAHSIQPSAVVPRPMYFKPEAAMTNVITGRM